jgi:hypothetical protein
MRINVTGVPYDATGVAVCEVGAPVRTTGVPVRTTRVPSRTTRVLVHTTRVPVHTTGVLARTTGVLVHTTEVPVLRSDWQILVRGADESVKPGVKRSETPGTVNRKNLEPAERAMEFAMTKNIVSQSPYRSPAFRSCFRCRPLRGLRICCGLFLGLRCAPPQALCRRPLRGLFPNIAEIPPINRWAIFHPVRFELLRNAFEELINIVAVLLLKTQIAALVLD